MDLAPSEHVGLIRRLRTDPIAHIEHVQGFLTLLEYQKKVIQEIALHDYVAVSACHDVGKTLIAALIVNWFGSVFRSCKIITTAPTWTQVEHLLWAEIRTRFHQSKIPLGGRMLNTEWKIDDDWFAIGLSPKDDADSSGGGQGKTSGFQGFHAPYMLVIFDEATGVPTKRWIQAQGMLTSANVKFLAIGNPTTKNCEFHRCFSSRLWRKIYLSCFDSPNLIANGITSLPLLIAELDILRELGEEAAFNRIKAYKVSAPAIITLAWVVDRALVWGVTHPLFISKVLGQFPDEDDFTLIPLGVLEEAQRRSHEPRLSDRCGLGVDVARYGTDKSVITGIWGKKVMPSKTLAKRDTMEIAGAVIIEMRKLLALGVNVNLFQIGVDTTGIGAGVYDSLKQTQREAGNVIPKEIGIFEVQFGQGFDYMTDKNEIEEAKKQYTNRKAKIFVELAQDLKSELALPDETIYLEELPTIQSGFDSRGKHVIESKEDYRDRTGRPSPDHSDAIAIANEMRKIISSPVGVMRVIRG